LLRDIPKLLYFILITINIKVALQEKVFEFENANTELNVIKESLEDKKRIEINLLKEKMVSSVKTIHIYYS
jgi:hypothetical protein